MPEVKPAPKKQRVESDAVVQETSLAGNFRRRAQIFDLAHERRLRAFHAYIEQGYTLSEAARLLGVSQLTVCRWNDHGRR